MNTNAKKILIITSGFLLLSVLLMFAMQWLRDGEEGEILDELPPPMMGEEAEPLIRHPLPIQGSDGEAMNSGQPVTNTEKPPVTGRLPLPPLMDSDGALLSDLGQILSATQLAKFFELKAIIARMVVTIDNLTRPDLPGKQVITRPIEGKFRVKSTESEFFEMDEKNAQRYESFIRFVEQLDTKALVGLYIHYYPLFQEAYEDLGFPKKYFNDRLINVIDHVLEAPLIDPDETAIQFKQPSVMYEFVDSDLEAMSSGQKTLLRIGKTNAQRVRKVLKEIRAEIVRRLG